MFPDGKTKITFWGPAVQPGGGVLPNAHGRSVLDPVLSTADKQQHVFDAVVNV